MSTTTTNTMITIHTNSTNVVSSVGAPKEAKNQCEGNTTFWFYNLIEPRCSFASSLQMQLLWLTNSLHA
jgi:hypothetical protein